MRLAKQFWRVQIVQGGDKLRTYDRGSKTYTSLVHAEAAKDGFKRQGIEVELWTTGPVEWKLVQPAAELPGQEQLF